MLRNLLPILVLAITAPALAQTPGNNPSQVTTPLPQNLPQAAPQESAPLSNKKFKDPYKAFEAGAYDQALQGFVDLQIEKPNDTDLMLSIGAAHYSMDNLEDATRSFESAAANGSKAVQAEAHYNLGNTYFKEGKLEESVKAYQRTLELNPNDEDAKFNIEYVRDEIRRRHEEAKKRQQDQENQQDKKQQEQNPNDKQDPNKQDEQKQEGEENQNQDGKQDAPEKDTDQDGLPDQQEKSAKNPTDPNNPDSDGDGLSDGEEDKNGNGQVDKEETDPNKKDSNGNGVSDGEEAKKAQEQQAQAKKGKQDMSKQDAERLLRNLGPERKPSKRGKKSKGRRAAGGKDW